MPDMNVHTHIMKYKSKPLVYYANMIYQFAPKQHLDHLGDVIGSLHTCSCPVHPHSLQLCYGKVCTAPVGEHKGQTMSIVGRVKLTVVVTKYGTFSVTLLEQSTVGSHLCA